MPPSEAFSGKYGLTIRLFNLIENSSKPQQIKLLRQIIGEKLNETLFKLIIELSQEQQLDLLDQLSSAAETDPPETTVRLEGTEPSMRENMRRKCLFAANYALRGRSFRSHILDIGIGGVLVETGERPPVGERLGLSFVLPDEKLPITVKGVIAWSGPQGFGVRFEDLSPAQADVIKAFVDRREQGAKAD